MYGFLQSSNTLLNRMKSLENNKKKKNKTHLYNITFKPKYISSTEQIQQQKFDNFSEKINNKIINIILPSGDEKNTPNRLKANVVISPSNLGL